MNIEGWGNRENRRKRGSVGYLMKVTQKGWSAGTVGSVPSLETEEQEETDLSALVAEYQRAYRSWRVACDVATDPAASSARRQQARRDRRTRGTLVHRLRRELRGHGIYHGSIPEHCV